MRLSDLQNAVGLRDRLTELNQRLRRVGWTNFSPDTVSEHNRDHLFHAMEAAKRILRERITAERNGVLQQLRRLGIVFDEEEEA